MLNRLFIISILLLFIGACAKPADEIAASYVSPLEFKDYSCTQLTHEWSKINHELKEVTKEQDEAAADDNNVTAFGMILFWPMLFAIDGDSGKEAELSRLKGLVKAIEESAIQEDCDKLLVQIDRDRKLETEKQNEENEKIKRNRDASPHV